MDRKILAAIIVLAIIAAIEGVYIALTINGLTGKFPGSINVIYDEYSEQLNANIKLIDDLNELKMENTALTNDYDELQQTYKDIIEKKNETEDLLSVIINDFSSLESDYNKALEALTELDNNYDNLWENYLVSQTAYDSLGADMTRLIMEYQEYQDKYQGIMKEINARAGLGNLKRRMITPDDNIVMNVTLQITSTTSDGKTAVQRRIDMRGLYDWVVSHISYSYDSPHPIFSEDIKISPQWISENYRYPNETLVEGHGDDEDHAVLLVSMLKAYDDNNDNYYVLLANSNASKRSAALITNDRSITILDSESGYYSGKEIGSLLEYPAEYAIQNWFNDWGEANMRVTSVFNMDVCVEFDSTQEFYDWVNGL